MVKRALAMIDENEAKSNCKKQQESEMTGPPKVPAAGAGDDHQQQGGAEQPTAAVSSWHPPKAVDSPFRVLGIALVAEELGKGARLVFRYPAGPPPSNSGSGSMPGGGGAATATGTGSGDQDPSLPDQPRASPHDDNDNDGNNEAAGLFFSLPDRTVAKLFRPKPALCGQPMTLSVGGTVFCCRAVLLPASTFGGGGTGTASTATSSASSAGAHSADRAGASAGGQSPPRRDATSTGNVDPHDRSASSGEGADAAAAAGGGASPNQLVLFSVIVALSPVKGYARTFRDGGGDERATAHAQASPKMVSSRKGRDKGRGRGKGKNGRGEASAAEHGGDGLSSSSFLAIRRIHVSLSRLCRVLEREERRCAYVSSQSAAFLRIISEIKEGPESGSGGGGGGSGGGASSSAAGRPSGSSGPDAGPSPGSTATTGKGGPSDGDMPGGAAAPKQVARPRHVRMGSNATAISIPSTPMTLNLADRGVSAATTDTSRIAVDHSTGISKGRGSGNAILDRDTQQAIIELIFAYSDDVGGESALPDDGGLYSAHREGQRLIHGNIGRELAQVFHALSRNDGNSVFFPTPSSLLSSRDGIVYINRHIAVPIEPASGFSNAADCFAGFGLNRSPTAYDLDVSIPQAVVRPYHTLLFPHAPPAELAKAMSHDHPSRGGDSDGTVPSSSHNQRLQRLLLMANPSKSLADIAVDAALSVPVTLQLASYLVESGTCTLAHVATRSARYAVSSAGVDRIRSLALPFSQTFGRAVPIFLAVAALTSSGATLGDILSSASSGTDENGIGKRIASSKAAAGRVESVKKEQKQFHQPSRSAAAIGRPRGGSLGNDMLTPPATGGPDKKSDLLFGSSADDIEDELYDMCLWLRAHGVIIELREYLAQVEPTKAHSEAGAHGATSGDASKEEPDQSTQNVKTMSTEQFLTSWNTESKIDKNNSSARSLGEAEAQPSQEEVIFRELQDIGDCLTGTTSTVALQWKYGIDTWRLRKLKDWGIATGRLATIHRVPCPGDDWGAP